MFPQTYSHKLQRFIPSLFRSKTFTSCTGGVFSLKVNFNWNHRKRYITKTCIATQLELYYVVMTNNKNIIFSWLCAINTFKTLLYSWAWTNSINSHSQETEFDWGESNAVPRTQKAQPVLSLGLLLAPSRVRLVSRQYGANAFMWCPFMLSQPSWHSSAIYKVIQIFRYMSRPQANGDIKLGIGWNVISLIFPWFLAPNELLWVFQNMLIS